MASPSSWALIYGIAWVMRRVKRSREEVGSGRGLTRVATLPLGSGRTLHLVRAGTDVILVGASEHGVAPIRVYTRGGGARERSARRRRA